MNSTQDTIFPVLLMPVLLLLSAFFSGSETALFSLTPESARRLRASRQSKRLLQIFYSNSSELLAAVLLGNLFVNILFFCTGAMLIGRGAAFFGEWFEAAGGFAILLIVILFGEIIPKAIGITLSERIVRMASAPLCYWFILTAPARWLISRVLDRLYLGINRPQVHEDFTSGELKELLDVVRHEPGFGAQEKEMFEDIVNLSELRVREVMVPRVQVMRRTISADYNEMIQTARQNEYSCVVMYRDDDDDDLLGYVKTGDLLTVHENAVSAESLIRPLVFVPETKRVDILLMEFLTHEWTMVAVADEYGGFSGIVTIEDLFAEVIGGVEPGEEEEIVKLDETTYRLSGQLPIRAWKDLLTGILPGYNTGSLAFDTLGGLITSLLGRVAVQNDTVYVRNLKLTVESMHRSRIETVLLHLDQPESAV